MARQKKVKESVKQKVQEAFSKRELKTKEKQSFKGDFSNLENYKFEKKERKTPPPVILEKEGDFFIGIFQEVKEVSIKNNFGPGKVMKKVYSFSHPETGEIFCLWGDGGFNGEFTYCDIQIGEMIKVVKGGKIQLESGRNCNSYEIFSFQK